MPNSLKPYSHPLSKREQQVLKLLACGYSNVQVATMLNLSSSTVRSHRQSIHSKLHLTSVTEMIRYALKNELIS